MIFLLLFKVKKKKKKKKKKMRKDHTLGAQPDCEAQTCCLGGENKQTKQTNEHQKQKVRSYALYHISWRKQTDKQTPKTKGKIMCTIYHYFL